jgi:hypothetical protein
MDARTDAHDHGHVGHHHDHGHHHSHAHGPASPHPPSPLPVSLLRWSLASRLAVATLATIVLWAVVAVAMH